MDVVTGMVSGITLQRWVKRAVVLTGLGLALGLAACGERPGRDDEVLYTEAYPDLASTLFRLCPIRRRCWRSTSTAC